MNLNLKRKIIGITVTIILVMTAIFGYFMKTAVYESLEEEIDRRAIAIGKHFAELSADADLTESTSLLKTHLADYIATESYLAYIIIFDANGRIQAHTFQSAVPVEILSAVTTNKSTESVHIFRRADGIELEDFFVKSGTSTVGGVHIGIYETKIANSIHNLMLKLAPFLLAVILSGIVVAFLLAGAITRPIQILSDGVKRVTRGDLDFVINVRTRDEIEQLAIAFNQMTGNLRESTVSRVFMEKLINTMNEILIVISPEGIVLNVNRAYYELFGTAVSDVVGRKVESFTSEEAPALLYAAYQQSLNSGVMQGIESYFVSGNGEQIPLLLSMAVMRNDNGAPQAIICAAQNIYSLKKIQKALEHKQSELEDVNRNLEEIVASRTAELAIGNEGLRAEVAERQKKTEELRAARDLAESANRAKSEFLANMSHEIRTPLNSIIGGTEYLDSTSLDDDQQRCLKMIHHAGDSLLVLINDLIDLSRIESGQLEIICRPFTLSSTIERVIEMVGQTAERKHLELSLDCDKMLPKAVSGDQIRLQQVLVNLVTNAVKFTESGGSVTIRSSSSALENGRIPVTFEITDTGIGIDPNKLEMIFDSFSQADTSITRRFGGSGLGLAISRKLVEAMGGTISVKSTPGVGSIFSITIPFLTTEFNFDQISRPAPAEPAHSGLIIDGGNIKRVLLVDDSRENLDLMQLLLKPLQLTIEEANNGQEALDMATQRHYDLVMMDIQMPVMDGYTATRMIRRHEERSGHNRVTIIALTAHAYESDIKKCLEAGCDDHIAKPFKKKTLLECLNKYLQGV